MARWAVTGIATVAFAMIVSGFGASSPRLSRPAYTKKANAICAVAFAKINKITATLKTTDISADAKALNRAASIASEATDRLRQLRPPKSIEASVGRWLDLMDRGVLLARQAARAFARGSLAAGLAKLRALDKADVQAGDAAFALHLLKCQTSG